MIPKSGYQDIFDQTGLQFDVVKTRGICRKTAAKLRIDPDLTDFESIDGEKIIRCLRC